ncbi:MAG: BlaI/MecI/CopY family transcriptional regulator [Saprospiraceae bacterium]|nr:BlaI/MecI/CopY family transcriptional regulator [Saprospiraceae bacterium]
MKRLTKAEEEIMQLFWDHGPSTVSALIQHMGSPKPPHSSISSIVRILEKKEFVDHKAYGRTYEYFPIVEKSTYSKFSLRRLVSHYFEGSMNELVSFLVKEDDISLNDLKELTKKFDGQEIDAPSPKN